MCPDRGSSESQCIFEAVEVAEMFLKADLVWVASDAGPTGLSD